MLFASVIQWKKHHPNHFCVLYADTLTFRLLNKMNASPLWDNTKIISKNNNIDKSVFWASSKLQTLQTVYEPIVIMDNDFVVYSSFNEYLNDDVVVAHNEDGENYYLNATDDYIKQVKHLIHRPNLKAVNCSFIYFPDCDFTKGYANRSIELMEEFTKIKAPTSKYLIYAEQLLLKHMLDIHNIHYDSLVDKVYNCVEDKFIDKCDGLIDFDIHRTYFRHYWKEKPKIKKSEDGFDYNYEVEQLENIVKNRKLIDWTHIND